MLTRRDTLRLAVLTALGSPVLGGCGDGQAGGVTTDPIDLAISGVRRGAGLPHAIPEVVHGLQQLAGGLYGGLATAAGNVALSPYSVAAALAMAVNGAGGRTAEEMRTVLGAADLDRYNGGLNALTAAVHRLAGPQRRRDGSRTELTLATANQLFGQRGTPWSRPFLDVLGREYAAGMRLVDFAGDTEAARRLINAWTAARTGGRIPEIVPPNVLSAFTRLALVNAVYLKAPWEEPFEKDLTARAVFHAATGDVQVDMMSGHPAAVTTQGDGWQAARLAYAGSTLAMTIVLPDHTRMGDVEAEVRAGRLAQFLAEGRQVLLDLRMPRWRLRTQAPLRAVLTALGMPTAFDEVAADFLAMTDDDQQLFIEAVLHEAFVAVDEDGTEAAAATAVVVNAVSAPEYVPYFVDRPFLFLIHDLEYGTPLFLGRVADPT